ncbi:hypothetical protein CMUST_10480 [Corynebacterium mustelae]|uniref:Uncharacterized protein n=1 Tax=Corynebacterium mustelae TaxID=571915 RepID=A0A0G3H5I3_9CORY|nr:hypothetical protein [Corynebacterium mustelae]AKK06412.1 hypothetical protein CMUST_10480 [Corynebacterium mustelae]
MKRTLIALVTATAVTFGTITPATSQETTATATADTPTTTATETAKPDSSSPKPPVTSTKSSDTGWSSSGSTPLDLLLLVGGIGTAVFTAFQIYRLGIKEFNRTIHEALSSGPGGAISQLISDRLSSETSSQNITHFKQTTGSS